MKGEVFDGELGPYNGIVLQWARYNDRNATQKADIFTENKNALYADELEDLLGPIVPASIHEDDDPADAPSVLQMSQPKIKFDGNNIFALIQFSIQFKSLHIEECLQMSKPLSRVENFLAIYW